MRWKVKYYERGQTNEATFTGGATDVRVRLTKEGKTVLKMQRVLSFGGGRKRTEEIISVLQALADLDGVGVPLAESVQTVSDSLDGDSELKAVLQDIHRRLDGGDSLPTIIETHRDVFGNTVTQMIKSGYETGNMAETLASSAKFVADMHRTSRDTWKQLTYPLTVLGLGMFLLLIDTQFLIPKLLDSTLFKTVVKEKDATIRALEIISVVIPLLFLLLAAAAVAIYMQNRKDPELVERLLIRIPMLKELIFYRYFFIGFFSLANLIEAGVRQSVALEIVRDAVDAKIVKREFSEALRLMREGEHFAKGFKNITNIERTMLLTSVSEDKVKKNMHAIADRFYRSYIARLQGISPKVYAITIGFAMCVFVLMAMAVMVPYGKVLSGL